MTGHSLPEIVEKRQPPKCSPVVVVAGLAAAEVGVVSAGSVRLVSLSELQGGDEACAVRQQQPVSRGLPDTNLWSRGRTAEEIMQARHRAAGSPLLTM